MHQIIEGLNFGFTKADRSLVAHDSLDIAQN